MSIISVNLPDININWKAIKGFFMKMLHIPGWLMGTVITVLILGVVYFTITRFYYNEDIRVLQQNIVELKERVDDNVESDDYHGDIEYILSSIRVLERIEAYQYNVNQQEILLIRKCISRMHPNDPSIGELDALMERNTEMYRLLKNHFEFVLRNSDSHLVNDSTYNRISYN